MKTILKTRYLAAAIALVLTASYQAQADDSGCGLGTLIFKSNGKLTQLLALTTNNTTLTNYFGITTGTSECKASGLVMREKEVEYFAEVNKDDLSREMAQGQGEKLATLASLYGCTGDSSAAFAKMTQSSYGAILPQATTPAPEMVKNLNREFSAHADLAKSCQAI